MNNMEALNSMIEIIANMNNEEQVTVFEAMKKNGLTEKDIDMIRERVFFHKLYNDKEFYNTVVETMADNLYTMLNS